MRRMWMLLLVLVLAVSLAVPALAATEAHDDTWKVLDGSETTLTEAGSYYLNGDLTASITVATEGEIVICLHSNTWIGDGARPLTITSGSVTICDCSYVAPSVDRETGAVGEAAGGKLVGYDYGGVAVTAGGDNGGAINIAAGATFTLESGIITDGRASYGGNIYNMGTVTINDGIVCDGETGAYNAATKAYISNGWGGNIENQGVLNINGGIISGGKAGGNGGNIRNTPAATLTMTGGVIAGGDSRDNGGNIFIQCNATLSDGLIIAGTANNGGNITANASGKTIVLSGMTIKNGVCCGSGKVADSQYDENGELVLNTALGGNVRIFNAAATLTINNGTVITGGQSNATDGSQNVYVGKTGSTLNLGTCTIDGYVNIVDTCTINVSGEPEITGGDTNLRIGKSVVTVGAMTGGEVGITTTAGVSAAFTAAVTSTAFENYFTSDNDALAVTYNYQDDKLWLGTAYCVCGASKNGGDHVQFTDADGNPVGCDGTNLGWLAWTSTTALPKGHGNFYLTAATTYSAQYAPEKNATMRLDLNGQTATDTSARTFATATANSSGSVNLWITDTSAEETGVMTTNTYSYAGQGVLARIADSSTLHLVAGTLNASNATINRSSKNYDGVALCIEKGCTFNMYGGTIYGGNNARHGGAVSIGSTASLNMYAGTIYGGQAANEGGAIYVNGDAYIVGGSIQGGRAGYGGAISVNGGTAVIKNCEIKNGTAVRAETQYETPEDGSEPTVATASNATGRGANVYVTSATVEMENCVISGGKIEFASGEYEPYELVLYTYEEDGVTVASTTYLHNNWGGTGILVTGAANVTVKDCEIYGGTELQEGVSYGSYQGGTIYINGYATLTLKGNTVVTASPVKQKGAVIHRANGSLYIQDNTLIDASYYYAYNEETKEFEPNENAPVSAPAGVAMNFDNGNGECVMTGGTVIGGTATGGTSGVGGGAIVMTGSTKFTLSGGTVKNGTSAYGGNILLNKGTLTINGGTIQDGTATAQGGNIYAYEGTITMSSGTIQGGEAPKNGGSVYVNEKASMSLSGGTLKEGTSTEDQGGNLFCGGALTISGGTIQDGTAKTGGNIAINSGKDITISNVTIKDGTATTGGNMAVNTTQTTGSVTLGNGASVTGGTATGKGGNIWLNPNNVNETNPVATLNITGATISGGTAATGPNIQANDADDCVTNLVISGTSTIGGYPAVEANVNLTWNGVILGDSYETVYTLTDALAAAGETDYIKLLSNLDAQNITKSCYVDLNGNALTNLTVAEGEKISLFDSTGSSYGVPAGSITLASGTTVDNFDRVMLTGSVLDKNYRYVTVAETDDETNVTTLTAHRFYLAVKSAVLYATENPTVAYRIVLRCDEDLAKLISGYGLELAASNSAAYDFVAEDGYAVNAWDGTNENSKVVVLGNVLKDDVDASVNKTRAETVIKGHAFLKINDDFNTDAITSSNYSLSLQSLVKNAENVFDSLSNAQKGALNTMYNTWADVMEGWSLTKIAAYTEE